MQLHGADDHVLRRIQDHFCLCILGRGLPSRFILHFDGCTEKAPADYAPDVTYPCLGRMRGSEKMRMSTVAGLDHAAVECPKGDCWRNVQTLRLSCAKIG